MPTSKASLMSATAPDWFHRPTTSKTSIAVSRVAGACSILSMLAQEKIELMRRSSVSCFNQHPYFNSRTPLISLYVEHFKLHLYNNQCRQIFFGCSHDNGFARTLEEILPEDGSTDRVTLLEGTPFEKELMELPFRTHKIQDLFRSQKITLYQNGNADGNVMPKPHLLNPGVTPFPAPLHRVASNNVRHPRLLS